MNILVRDVYLGVFFFRIGFEMIQKAVRAGIPILIRRSDPPSMALECGMQGDRAWTGMDEKSGFVVPCGERRIRAKTRRPAV